MSHAAARVQVATYHYDIKRMDDQLQTGGLQARGCVAHSLPACLTLQEERW